MDKTSKVICAMIAAGLWFNAASNLLRPAQAQDMLNLSEIAVSVKSIANALHILIQGGTSCSNHRLCQ